MIFHGIRDLEKQFCKFEYIDKLSGITMSDDQISIVISRDSNRNGTKDNETVTITCDSTDEANYLFDLLCICIHKTKVEHIQKSFESRIDFNEHIKSFRSAVREFAIDNDCTKIYEVYSSKPEYSHDNDRFEIKVTIQAGDESCVKVAKDYIAIASSLFEMELIEKVLQKEFIIMRTANNIIIKYEEESICETELDDTSNKFITDTPNNTMGTIDSMTIKRDSAEQCDYTGIIKVADNPVVLKEGIVIDKNKNEILNILQEEFLKSSDKIKILESEIEKVKTDIAILMAKNNIPL